MPREREVANPVQSLNPIPIVPRPRMDTRFAISATLAIAALSASAIGAPARASTEQVTVEGPAGARLRIEAREPHVMRIWMKPSGDFTRPTSLAMEAAADTHSPLTRSEKGDRVTVSTGALDVTIARATLAFEVRAADGGPTLLADARIGAQAGGLGRSPRRSRPENTSLGSARTITTTDAWTGAASSESSGKASR